MNPRAPMHQRGALESFARGFMDALGSFGAAVLVIIAVCAAGQGLEWLLAWAREAAR
jgi:hypothetical protein